MIFIGCDAVIELAGSNILRKGAFPFFDSIGDLNL